MNRSISTILPLASLLDYIFFYVHIIIGVPLLIQEDVTCITCRTIITYVREDKICPLKITFPIRIYRLLAFRIILEQLVLTDKNHRNPYMIIIQLFYTPRDNQYALDNKT